MSALVDLLLEAALRAAPAGALSPQLHVNGDGIELGVDRPVDRETMDLAATLAEAYGGTVRAGTIVVR